MERQVAFLRIREDDAAAIYTVPSLGGQERKLVDIAGPLRTLSPYFIPRFSWSPKGDWLALAEKATAGGPPRIVRLSLETLEKQTLTAPPPGSGGDLCPALSPDGTQIAFVRVGSSAFADLDVWIQRVEGGEARRLTSGKYDLVSHLAWSADGAAVVFDAGTVRSSMTFRVRLSGGEPEPIPGVGQGAGHPSIRRTRLVYEQWVVPPSGIWRAHGRAATLPRREPARLIASSGGDGSASYSPDGRRIAFSSDRGGDANIWVCDSDGRNPAQLTSYDSHTGTPRWSPDGRRLAFDSLEAGRRRSCCRAPSTGMAGTCPGAGSTSGASLGPPRSKRSDTSTLRPVGSRTCRRRRASSGAWGWPSPPARSGSSTLNTLPRRPS